MKFKIKENVTTFRKLQLEQKMLLNLIRALLPFAVGGGGFAVISEHLTGICYNKIDPQEQK